MSSYLLQLAGYTLPATMRPNGGDSNVDLAEQELPRRDGSITQAGRRKSRLLTIRGSITAATADALQTVYDAMRAALYIGLSGQLFFGRDDRYANAQIETWTDDTSDGVTYGVVINIDIGLRLADPYWYGATGGVPSGNTTVSGLAAGGTVTPPNSTSAVPTWTVTVSGAGTGTITVTNSSTGETATLSGTFANGDTIVMNRSTYAVTWNGVSSFGLLSGRIPSLEAGANTITTSASTVAVGTLSCAFLPRYN